MGATRTAFLFSLCLGALATAGCGGGGGGGSSSALPPAPPPSGGGSTGAPASLTFTIVIPSATTSSGLRRPRYISAGTKSATIGLSGNKQTVNCTNTCNMTLQVTPGTLTIVASLFDGPDGTGSVLATGTTTATIVGGQQNSVAVVFGGVVSRLDVSLGTSSVTSGASMQTPVVVKAMDAAGYTIVGPEPYASPIVLASDDRSGATSLSATTLTSPNATANVTYNGSASLSAVHISASVPGTAVASQTATLAISAPPVTSGPFPDHVRTMAYYGLNGINHDIPASYMAAHVDIVEDDGYTAPHADAFKRAGGKMAFAYTDPTYAAHCPAPFTPPAGACTGQIANLIPSDESAYVHDTNGARVHRFVSDYFQYQEVFNVKSPAVQKAYAAMTASILAASPLIDAFEADDSGSPLTITGRSLGSELYLGFNTVGVEIATDADWIAGHKAMLAAAGKPLMINGGDTETLGAAYGGTFVDLPFVMGQQFEGCYNHEGPYLYTDNDNQFVRESNGLLDVYAHHKSAMCFPSGDTVPEHRLYGYAAWLQTYDPVYSIYMMELPQSDGESLYPETQLVPTQPRTTASNISQNRAGGVYVREFAACAIASVPIGPCASVVNSSPTASAAIPPLSISYGKQIALDPQSLYHGGKANVVAGAPTSLAPATAAILVR